MWIRPRESVANKKVDGLIHNGQMKRGGKSRPYARTTASTPTTVSFLRRYVVDDNTYDPDVVAILLLFFL
jgi:hypothetical protein